MIGLNFSLSQSRKVQVGLVIVSDLLSNSYPHIAARVILRSYVVLCVLYDSTLRKRTKFCGVVTIHWCLSVWPNLGLHIWRWSATSVEMIARYATYDEW